MSNNKHEELTRQIAAEIAASEGTQVKEVAMSTSTEVKGKRPRVPKRVSSSLLDWKTKAESRATDMGVDTSDRSYLFEELNASETKPIKGKLIHMDKDEQGMVVDARFIDGDVQVPVHTPIYRYIVMEGMTVVKLSGDPIAKAKAYTIAARKLWNAREKYLLGNLKSEDSILVVATRTQAEEMLGSDLGLYDNPFKPWLAAYGTPTRLAFKEGPDTIRVRIIDDLKTKWGHKYHDGTIIHRCNMMYEKYLPPEAGLTQEENDARPRELVTIKSSAQVRHFGKKGSTYYPAVKAKCYHDEWAYFGLSQQFGFDPYEADAIMCLTNLKTKNHNFKHGDVYEMPMEFFRIIGISSRSGRSSIGGQAVCLDLAKIQDIFKEKGMAERSRLLKDAACGDAKSLEDIILGQEEHSSFEDVTIMWILNMMFAFKRPGSKYEWDWPRFDTNHNNVAVRLNRYLQDNVMKCRLSSVALYLEVNPMLDEIEHEYFAKEGKHINYVILPNKSSIRKMMVGYKDKKKDNEVVPAEYKYLNIGRNPVVWQGNLQGVELLKDSEGRVIFNESKDTIEISAAFAHEMFGDQDGDKVIFAPSNVSHFPVFRTELPEPGKKTKVEPAKLSGSELAKLLVEASIAICEAAMDTGVLDYTARQILVEAWLAGSPLKPDQVRAMGDMRENAIQRQKHKQGKTAQNVETEKALKDLMIEEFAVGGKLLPARMAPAEFVITKRYADRRGKSERVVFVRKLEIINASKFKEGFPFTVATDEIKGVEFTIDNTHSHVIQEMFKAAWERCKVKLQRNKEAYGFDINTVVQKAKFVDSYYREQTSAAIKMDQELKQEEFRNIRKKIRFYLETKLKGEFGEFHDKFMRYLTIYMGTISFGVSTNNRSRSGLALRMWPEDHLIHAARLCNPDNPWCKVNEEDPNKSRAEKMIARLLAKKAETPEVEA